MTTDAFIYTRLSLNRDGTKTGNERQLADCQAYCKRNDLRVLRVFTDDDTSELYSGRKRPEYTEMMGTLDAVSGGAIVYWKTDRLVRRQAEFGPVMIRTRDAGVALRSVLDPIDTSTPIGQGIANMLVAVAEQESFNTATRIRRSQEEQAKIGNPHGGARRFGYTADGLRIVPAEARAIRRARDRVLRGDTMSAIVNDMNAKGITPVRAKTWNTTTFRRMIAGAYIAGVRVYKGDELRVGTWPGIITPAEHRAVVKVLTSRAGSARGPAPRYLLTGLCECSRCHQRMRSSGGTDRRMWQCLRPPGEKVRCGRCAIRGEDVDAFVEAQLVDVLSSKRARQYVQRAKKRHGAPDVTEATITELEDKLIQLGLDSDNGIIERKEELARRGPLQKKLDLARSTITRENGHEVLADVVLADDPAAAYYAKTLEQKRRIAAKALAFVEILPPKAGANRFNPNRVKPHWLV